MSEESMSVTLLRATETLLCVRAARGNISPPEELLRHAIADLLREIDAKQAAGQEHGRV